ncbi:hypothetical protein JX580_02365 [Thiomicrospira microaerophila]|uniref:hypothetical protein n=1 Tax=Thiomicrospira microaerophila TaxID=406020 RepID=UPI00200BD44E|nr:hypothetical protein [Thiomicrospira microaerophila]UQB42762.1 hypothetical protein JX580_02365 [Thiomicrospira microaerophila]
MPLMRLLCVERVAVNGLGRVAGLVVLAGMAVTRFGGVAGAITPANHPSQSDQA